MARSAAMRASAVAGRLGLGFAAGFLATVTFHQIGVWMFHSLGLTVAVPWARNPVLPFGVPRIISLAFWGGVWGVLFALVERWMPRRLLGYWAAALSFGTLVPTLSGWLIVQPLRGLPIGNGFRFPATLTGPVDNALWGLGMALFLGVLGGWRRPI